MDTLPSESSAIVGSDHIQHSGRTQRITGLHIIRIVPFFVTSMLSFSLRGTVISHGGVYGIPLTTTSASDGFPSMVMVCVFATNNEQPDASTSIIAETAGKTMFFTILLPFEK